MHWEPVLTDRNSLQTEKAAPEQKDREQAEEKVMAQGSTGPEDMGEAGAAAPEGVGAGESKAEGGNDFCYVYRCYYLETYSMIYT
jgi:hypothetical protein